MDVNTFAPYTMTKQYEDVYHAICNIRNNGTLMVHWQELKDVIKNAGIAKDPERIKIVKLLSDLVCNKLGDNYRVLKPKVLDRNFDENS